jgi:hypothetical protein
MYPAEDFKPNFLSGMKAAANWALDDSRPAWTRAIAASRETRDVKDPHSRQKHMIPTNRYRLTDIVAAKVTVRGTVDALYTNWLNGIFGNATDLFIKKMEMDYNLTHAGAGAGSSRANVAKNYTATKPNKATFGLKDNDPEKLWKRILTGNLFTGSGAASPAIRSEIVASQIPFDMGLDLSSHDDGWGVE